MKRFRDTKYFITEDGRVFSEMKLETREDYTRVSLRVNNETKKFSVHRMVAECYIPNPENKAEVNHKNFNKSDNSVKNLEWNTRKENIGHVWINGKTKCFGENHNLSKLTKNDVIYIRKNYIPRHKEFSMKALSKKFNVSIPVISNVIHNKTWKHIKQ